MITQLVKKQHKLLVLGVQTNASGRYADWDNHMNPNTQPTNEVPSELEAYLSKQVIPRSDDFDILGW
jgi:hypothetical protein